MSLLCKVNYSVSINLQSSKSKCLAVRSFFEGGLTLTVSGEASKELVSLLLLSSLLLRRKEAYEALTWALNDSRSSAAFSKRSSLRLHFSHTCSGKPSFASTDTSNISAILPGSLCRTDPGLKRQTAWLLGTQPWQRRHTQVAFLAAISCTLALAVFTTIAATCRRYYIITYTPPFS